jgi:hypothetical protein
MRIELQTLKSVREAVRDNRVMELVREFSENPPREDLIAKDWDASIAVAMMLSHEEKPHLVSLLRSLSNRVEAWSILNPGRLPTPAEPSKFPVEL